MTLGRRYLLATLQIVTGREVALRAHVSGKSVSRWAAGELRPAARARAALEQHVGIPRDAWDRPYRRQRSTLQRSR